MIETLENKFLISLEYNEGHKLPVYYPPNKHEMPYVVAEKSLPFRIVMNVNSEKINDRLFYGSKLIIDGEEILGIKTFRRQGRYFGYKLGNGIYKEFLFSNINYQENNVQNISNNTENNSNQINNINKYNSNSNIGNIKLTFYTTKSIKVKYPSNKYIKQHIPHSYKKNKIVYETSANCKKVFEASMQVGEGKVFDNGHSIKKHAFKPSRYENIIDFNNDIDEIEINYSDFYSMINKGFISSFNINHFKYFPFRIKLDFNLLKNAIKTLVNNYYKNKDNNNNNTLNTKLYKIEDLHLDFKRYSEHDMSLYYTEANINKKNTFVDMIMDSYFNNLYEIKDTMYIKFKNNQILDLNLLDDVKLFMPYQIQNRLNNDNNNNNTFVNSICKSDFINKNTIKKTNNNKIKLDKEFHDDDDNNTIIDLCNDIC